MTQNIMPEIHAALEEKLDIGQAFPIVRNMSVQMIIIHLERELLQISEAMQAVANDNDEEVLKGDDAFEYALLLIDRGVNIPGDMLYEICKEILLKTRNVNRCVAELPCGGTLWHSKLYITIS